MSHTIHTLPDAQREIRAVIPWNEWKDLFDSFFEEAIRSVSIKGFRAGKAPRALAAQQVNRAAVATEAAHKKIAQHYADVVQKEKLTVLGEPEIAVQKLAEGNELAYNAKVLLMPDVKLSAWRDAVAVVNKEMSAAPSVSDEDVESALAHLAQTRATTVVVDRPAQTVDNVVIDFDVMRDNVVIEGGTGRDHALIIGNNVFIPGFEEQLIGMQKGDTKTFTLVFPENYHAKHLAGQEAVFAVTVKAVEERTVPEMTDAFAQTLGNFADRAALAQNVREGLTMEKEERRAAERREKYLDVLRAKARVDVSQALIAQETKRILQEMEARISMSGLDFQTYLTHLKKTREELEKEWEEHARARILGVLILEKIAEMEDITPTPEEIEQEMNKAMRQYKSEKDARKNADLSGIYRYAQSVARSEKVFAYLEKI